ncbi:aspartate kinase [Saccharothrix australiensis]|uniref:Aspartokinase n=1 Tax=Saccharothrix australiensis TaxID=2072 RepID=A0A495W2X8_9PSEU|nr:aspartate kinase [Saccharothrix australiensis]RKT55704.1 aspartate kinase [Saccharothrix australiensis]
MKTVVRKYGGSSLATLDDLRAVAGAVAAGARDQAMVVVVSARGKTTDELLRTAALITPSPAPREVDQLLATGEIASAAQLALAVTALGVPAVSLTGAQAGIAATGEHGSAMIEDVDPTRMRRHLAAGEVVVISGFQGCDGKGDTVTLGRGASDTTAVAVAAALGVRDCEIRTDVDGVHTADPRVVPGARLLPAVGADVMTELAFAGARVLHSRAAELAASAGVRLVVRDASGRSPGTTVLGRSDQRMLDETRGFVTAVAQDDQVVLARVRAADHDVPASVLSALAGHRVAVDMVSWTGSGQHCPVLGFALHGSRLEVAEAALAGVVDRHRCAVELTGRVGKLSVVGTGLLNRPEHTALMVRVLGELGITPIWLATTQLRSSVLVPVDRLAEGVRALHRRFGLDRDGSPATPTA